MRPLRPSRNVVEASRPVAPRPAAPPPAGASPPAPDRRAAPATARPVQAEVPAPGRLGKLAALVSSSGSPEAHEGPDAPRAAPQASSLEDLSGRVTRVIFHAPESGYTVYAVKGKAAKESILAVTSPILAAKGDKVVAKGSWGEYKGRPTFKAVMLMHDVPKGAKGVVTWLKTKAAEGVGKAVAENVGRYFGERLEEVVGDADALMEAADVGRVRGFTRAKAEAIAEAWNTNANQPELIAFLGRFNIGEMTIAKIVRRYGGAARRVIRDNPWSLAETIDGIGFSISDAIATEAGHAKDSPQRIKAGLRYALRQKTGQEGHCGLPRDELVEAAVSLLRLDDDLVAESIPSILEGGLVSFEAVSGLYYPADLLKSEASLAASVAKLLEGGDRIGEGEAREAVEASSASLGITLDPSQVEAAVMALSSPVSVITGGPGTGKSTTQKVIVRALEALERQVALAAPTGRAAKRLAEVSGRHASTCHRLLAFSADKGGFEFDASNPFEEDRFIVDETSMVDVRLGASFLEAIHPQAGLTIVGDVDQLPSVGAGQVLRDLIESGVVPVARLTVVHRQAGDSGIVVAAHRINEGEHPRPDPFEDLDGFDINEIDSPDDIKRRVVALIRDELPAMGHDPIKEVQVLAAMRKGDLGIEELNKAIKAALNPSLPDNSVEIRGRSFATGDRVMHLRNDYTKKVYNGEVGTVVHVGTRKGENGKEEPTFKVDYSGHFAWYGPKDIEDVELSWAATVHKSQGCEFPVVVFVCPYEHRRMLTRNLVYTGITRGKAKCIVVGHDDALALAVRTADTNRRFTGLSQRLRAAVPANDHFPGPGGLAA